MTVDPQRGDRAHRFASGFGFDPEGIMDHTLAEQQVGKINLSQFIAPPLSLLGCGLRLDGFA